MRSNSESKLRLNQSGIDSPYSSGDARPADDPAAEAETQDRVLQQMMEHPGRWMAWDSHQNRLLAVADSFADARTEALAVGEPDPVVERAHGFPPDVLHHRFTLLPDESPNIIEDLRKTIPDADAWLNSPNTRLWLEKPRDLIGTDQEQQLRYLLRGIRNGITT